MRHADQSDRLHTNGGNGYISTGSDSTMWTYEITLNIWTLSLLIKQVAKETSVYFLFVLVFFPKAQRGTEVPFLSVLLSAPDRRTQAALPCPCDYSLFKESGATVYHCAVIREVRSTAHSQHSLGFLCQVTTSCVYFLCFLSASTL